jgi:hypothetical protein
VPSVVEERAPLSMSRLMPREDGGLGEAADAADDRDAEHEHVLRLAPQRVAPDGEPGQHAAREHASAVKPFRRIHAENRSATG